MGAIPTREGVVWRGVAKGCGGRGGAEAWPKAVVVQRQGPSGATTMIAAVVAWANDRVQQGQDQVGKFSSRHLTDRSPSSSISLFLFKLLVENVLQEKIERQREIESCSSYSSIPFLCIHV
jgi:hypothetical protein